MEPRRPQRLVGVDVADAGEERLVEQQRLEPALPAPEPAAEVAHVNAGSSGSGPKAANTAAPPTSVTSSPVTGSRPYSPTRPNLRMSRKRSSRPSASSRTSRTYGSTGVSAGTTNSWPVILRWIVRAASPDSSTTTSFARRPTASTRRPATASANASGVCVRSVRAHERARADDRRADDARPQVARDGLDLGKLRHRRPTRASGASGASIRGLVGLGGDRVGAGQRRHRLPVVADLDVDGQRHVERQRALHRLAHDRHEPVDLVARHLEQQLVVDLEQQPGPEAAGGAAARRAGSSRSS